MPPYFHFIMGNQMTILDLTSELDQVVIYCGLNGADLRANFSLRVSVLSKFWLHAFLNKRVYDFLEFFYIAILYSSLHLTLSKMSIILSVTY